MYVLNRTPHQRKHLTLTFPPKRFTPVPHTRPSSKTRHWLTPPSSAYGPQLGVRLGLSHTQQNLVGLGGNGTRLTFPVPTPSSQTLPGHQLGPTAQVLFLVNLSMRAARSHPLSLPSLTYSSGIWASRPSSTSGLKKVKSEHQP